MMLQVVGCLVISALLVTGMPTDSKGQNTSPAVHANEKESPLISGNVQLLPENQPIESPDMTELVEVKEEEIPDGEWVIEMEEPVVPPKEAGEMLETAHNVVFRPLFRYRQKQGNRRFGQANRRIRRRYYSPRRSYRQTGYYRPYRSANYYNPYRRYGYYG